MALAGARLPRVAASAVGVGSVASSAAIALALAAQFFSAPPTGHAVVQSLWTFFDLPGLRVEAALRLDALSLIMMLVVTVVGAYYYLRTVAMLFSKAEVGVTAHAAVATPFGNRLLPSAIAVALFVIGVYPAPLLAAIHALNP